MKTKIKTQHTYTPDKAHNNVEPVMEALHVIKSEKLIVQP